MSKKNRNIVVAIVCVVIFLSALYTRSKSSLVRQLNGPTEGTEDVLTVGDKLFAVSKDNHIFTWQWNDFEIWPVIAKPSATAITPFANDKIFYNPSNDPAKLPQPENVLK